MAQRRALNRALAGLAAALLAPPASAQGLSFSGPSAGPQPPLQIKPPAQAVGTSNAFLPKAPHIPLAATAPVLVGLAASLTEKAPPLSRGVAWRVYATEPDAEGRHALIEKSDQAQPALRLKPGDYVVTALYGAVAQAQRITVSDVASHRFVLNAGGLRLGAVVGADKTIPEPLVTYTVYKSEPERPEGMPLASEVRSGQVVRLAEGAYRVVSRYGAANAVVQCNVRVEAGRLTDATVFHKAAAITMKLVNEAGGEAIANTSWSIVDANGAIVIQDNIGAFPTVILAAGDYTVIARHEGQIYNRAFSVEPGRDREVEVTAQG